MSCQDHFWYKAIGMTMKKLSADHLRKMKEPDFQTIREVFDGAGGSWEDLSEGEVEAWQDLRSACKSFLKVRKRKGKRPFEPSKSQDDKE